LVKYLAEFHARGEYERAASLCPLGYLIDFVVALLAFLGIILLASWASQTIVHRPDLSWLLILYAFAFLPQSLQGTSYAVLAVHGRFSTVALINTVTTLVRVALVLGLVLGGWSVIGVVVGNAVAMGLTGLVYAFSAWLLIRASWGTIPWSATWANLKGYRREILRFLAYNNLNALLGMIPKQLDVVLLGYFRNPTEVGFYNLAKKFASSVNYLVGPLQSVTYPRLTRLSGIGDFRLFGVTIKQFIHNISFSVVIMLPIVTLLLPRIVSLLAGTTYKPSIPLVQILLPAYWIWLAFFWLKPAYFAMGYVKRWTVGIAISSIAFILLATITVPLFGPKGLSFTQLTVTTMFHFGMGGYFYATLRNTRTTV